MLCRGRVCALGLLLTLYLAGVLLISTVTLDAQHKNSQGAGGRSRGVSTAGGGIRAASRRNRLQWCQTLRFLDEPGPVVALASFPGRIYTGSVYKDYGLLKNGFPAESVVNGSVSVVKTHEWGPAARKPFSKAVLLIRAPDWQQFVSDKLSAWRQTNLDWLHNFTGPMHIMYYDHLLEDVDTQLRALLRFLKLNVSEQDMACALERREGIYRRKRRVINFDPFTSHMKQILRKEQDSVYEAVANFHKPETTLVNGR
ncbi:WSCD family member [Blattella germanica]|nr:WSCD family member [Blattella germanica]